jgi:hypothetical protein
MKNLYRFNEFLLEDAKKSIGDFAENLMSSMDKMKTLAAEAKKKEDAAIPFKDNDEGNKFREWVNKEDPAWAKENQLDKQSSKSNGFNNSYIQKAWEKYGKKYKESQDKK